MADNLLKEDGDALLKEDGDNLLLEDGSGGSAKGAAVVYYAQLMGA